MQSSWLKKRMLGLLITAAGVVGFLGIAALNLLRSRDIPIGPAQKLALLACGGIVLVGLSLAWLGREPSDSAESSAAQTDVSPTLRLIQQGLLIIGAALLLFHTVVYINYAITLTPFPFDYDQGEGFELNDTVLLSQGQWPYRDNEIFPFYASNYPPLYHVILVPFVWLFGPQYWYGRVAGFLATLITAGAIMWAVYRHSRHRLIAVMSGLAYLASNYVFHVGPLFRQHISMVMLETLAVVIIAGIDFRTDSKQWRGRLLIGLGLLLAAGYTKQLAVATVGAVFLYLLLYIPRRAILWGAILAAVAGVIFLWINVSTGGQWLLNIITANVNEYILNQFRGLLSQFVSLHGALLILGLLFAAYELYFDRLSLYTIWFGASALNAVLAGKWGAGDSYYATTIAAMCVLAGIFTARSVQGSWHVPPLLAKLSGGRRLSPYVGIAACGLFIVYGLAVIKVPLDGPLFGPLTRALNIPSNTKFPNFYDGAGWTMGYATIGQSPTEQDVINGNKIVDAVKGDPRPILSEEAAFSFHTNKPVVTNPTQLRNLYLGNHYNAGSLVKMIEDQAFGAVILRADSNEIFRDGILRAGFYPEPVLVAIAHAYKNTETYPMNGYVYAILRPDPEWPAKRASGQ